MIAIVAPGQGSQKPGMLASWCDPTLSEAREVSALIDELSEAAGLDLRYFGTEAVAEEIVDTAVAQPLIVAFSLIGLASLGEAELPADETVFAGHSVGELTALAGCGVLTPFDAVALARARGIAMAKCCAATDGSMAALLGVDAAAAEEIAAGAGVRVANHNGGGQVVVGGARDRVAALAADPPTDVKVVEMKVAGAFHTDLMSEAQQELADAVERVRFAEPVATMISSTNGRVTASGFADIVVSAVTAPVRWDLCTQTLQKIGADHRIELPPAGALSSMARRENPRPTSTKITDPASVAELVRAVRVTPNRG